jgi:hypothetical protein
LEKQSFDQVSQFVLADRFVVLHKWKTLAPEGMGRSTSGKHLRQKGWGGARVENNCARRDGEGHKWKTLAPDTVQGKSVMNL